ncbi:MAG: type II toxin-antitoxin system VapC family toxin [Gammaproteobacteria bacterium]|nr:type II toxin-antitoxin system VapC family toxin [Gammaproteobacteria bacterium]MDE0286471.1 type II toxin-antitoxin system VapC family toxin [Gammaproteobacteria bacterium]MDE0514620.1 type II toxin-antitoxin system VapC family toxin [Gammaproteobacteria bacterium]
MNIVDSSGWLSYFASDKNSRSFADPIGKLEELLVPSITLTEVFKNILRQGNEEAALRAIAHMEQGKVVPLNEELAVDAAYFGVEYKLPLADSIIYATAHRYEAMVWTQDADFRDLKNVRYYPK